MSEYDTKLSSEQEAQFLKWKAVHAPNDSGEDYDLRGAFLAKIKRDARGHGPDTFKKPNHPTFSKDSRYSTPKNPGGDWIEKDGKMKFIASPANLAGRTPEDLKKYFAESEPDVELVIPRAIEERLYGGGAKP